MNTYSLSDGSRKTKGQIDLNVRLAKCEFISNKWDHRYCETCGITHGILDVSHIVSVDDCQKQGKSEQAWNPQNFELLCRDCHTKFESKKVLNKKREEYITEFFPELLGKYTK
jgi:5-methylcytosine-specific restriction endonuclease McrA